MRIATLLLEQTFRDRTGSALTSMGIEVRHFAAFDTLLDALRSESFAAILVVDDARHIGHWLSSLQSLATEPFALIAVGAGGVAGMTRALNHGADDYIVIENDTEHLVHRTIARAGSKIQRRSGVLRVGHYALDTSQSTLSSATRHVRLSPRELALARLLFEDHGRTVALERLCSELCGQWDEVARRAVKQHAHTLRKKCRELAESPTSQLIVESIYGQGYRLRQ
jgi:two-component system response regulator QseB